MNRLKEQREKNNLTLRELGKKINMSSSRISQYETGRREPKLETWQKLADFFGVSVSYLQGLTIDRRDVLKILNSAYYDFFKYPKPKPLIDCINDFIELLDISAPKDCLSEVDLKSFSNKAFDYWNKNFDFLFVCGRIEYLFDLPRARVSKEEIVRQLTWTIKEIEIKLTSTKISDLFDNTVDATLADYYENRERLVRFNTREEIEQYTTLLLFTLSNFLEKMKDLPENSKDQYTPKIVRARLNKFVSERKKDQLYFIP